MSKRNTVISSDQLSLSIVEGELFIPELMSTVVQGVMTDSLPAPRTSVESDIQDEVWPNAVDLAVYRRSMLDALTPIGTANQLHGFVKAAANPDAHADIYRRYGQNVRGLVEEKGHRADRIMESSRRWFFIAQGLGNLVTTKSSELTAAQVKARSEAQQLWDSFTDTYATPGPVTSKKRNAYIKSLKANPAALPSSLQYAPAELMLRLV